MHLRKFEADSMAEALKNIQETLGPDAVVLKTKTNKTATKGGNKKIEVTAGISKLPGPSKKVQNLDEFLHVPKKEKETLLNRISQRIEQLESQMSKIQQDFRLQGQSPFPHIKEIGLQLRSLGVDENLIKIQIKKLSSDLSERDLEDRDKVFDFLLQGMMKEIVVKKPAFLHEGEGPSITVLVGGKVSGKAALFLRWPLWSKRPLF